MSTGPRRIGFLADTHSRKADGSDLPDQVLSAFKGTDLIVHLGDIGQKGILARLGEVAPVLVPAGANKGYVPASGGKSAPIKVIESGTVVVGVTFNLMQPDKEIGVDGDQLTFPATPLVDLLTKRFGRPVDVVAFGGTHVQHEEDYQGVLFLNPGSPTLPADRRGDNDLGSVAILDLAGKKPKVKFVRLSA